MVNFRHMRGITVWQQLLVYAASADDINLLRVISLDRLQKLFDGMHNLRILLLICLVAGQDNIIPVFEGLSARKCIHRLSSEHDNLSGRLLSEHLMICRNPHQQLPFIANRPIFIHCYNQIHAYSPFIVKLRSGCP